MSARPLDAPTWDEVQTILQCAKGLRSRSYDALVICAYTGLRLRQACRLVAGDFALGTTPSLTVRGELGKSRAERMGRVVPLAPAIVPMLRELVAGLEPDQQIIERQPQSETLHVIMEAAEAAGVRPSIWRAARRGNKRPSHWARAAFQMEMRRQGVPDNVTDVLVGHHGASVRDRHYAPATWADQVAAVGTLPELPSEESNVVRLHG